MAQVGVVKERARTGERKSALMGQDHTMGKVAKAAVASHGQPAFTDAQEGM